jgi:hypothetical protein
VYQCCGQPWSGTIGAPVPASATWKRIPAASTSWLMPRTWGIGGEPDGRVIAVYELTDLGEGLGASLEALARWGIRTLPPTREDRSFRASWLVLALRARFTPQAAVGLSESYEFRIDSDVVCFEVVDGKGEARLGAARDPAVIIAADADTFLELVAGVISPSDARRRGATIHGEAPALERMGRILSVPGSAANLPDRIEAPDSPP